MHLNNLRDTLAQLKERLSANAESTSQSDIAKLMSRLEQELRTAEQDIIDIREYCENYHQPLCITDGNGVVIYVNDLYTQEIQFSREEMVGKPETFPNPISIPVMKHRHAITYGNDGSWLALKNGHMVSGVPIFDQNGEIRNIVITLVTDEDLYRYYRELQELMSRKGGVHIWTDSDGKTSQFLGKNPDIRNIQHLVNKVAPTDATVLITGESGSGKEVVADYIYSNSNRKGKPFIKINCTAIPPNLLEPELFGYEKGAFTGASSRKLGLFETANGGTILLDEIGDLPMELQPKLLRVLQQGEIYRIGSNTPIKVDVRIIAATNIDLAAKIHAGLFREDLYYRINVFPIHLPPLRVRGADIIELAEHFLAMYCSKYKRTANFSPEILDLFRSYSWPGNVRELQNVVEYYVICSEPGNTLSKEQISHILCRNQCDSRSPFYSGLAPKAEPPEPPQEQTEGTFYELRDNYEKQLIVHALKRTGNSRRAAKLLGILPSTLYRKAQKYHISLSETKELHYK